MSRHAIHVQVEDPRATVTQANVDYEGSISIDASLLEAADILPFEEVHVWDVTRGSRLVTYAMSAEPGWARSASTRRAPTWYTPATWSSSPRSRPWKTRPRIHRPKVVLVDEPQPVCGVEPIAARYRNRALETTW